MAEPSVQISAEGSPLFLVFYPDNPCSTKMYESSSSRLHYIVETEVLRQEGSSKKSTVTTVKRGSGGILAHFEWKDMFSSDIVSLAPAIAGSSEGTDLVTMPANSWLKRSLIPFKETVTYKNPDRKGFKWKGFGPGLSLELYSPESSSDPAAKFYSANSVSTSDTLTRSSSGNQDSSRSSSRPRSRLVLNSSLVNAGLADETVVAFLYLEKLRRARDDDNFNPVPKS